MSFLMFHHRDRRSARLRHLLSACLLAGANGGCLEAPGPSFSEEVAPIIEAQCVGCHTTGGVAPISFEDPEDVAAFSTAIASEIKNRTMPPFNVNNDGSCRSFANPRWLSNDEIDMVLKWSEQGAAVEPSRALDAPSLAALEQANVTLQTPEFLPDQVPDHYRCFVLDPELDTDAFLTGVSVVPGVPEITHHMLLFSVVGAALDEYLLEDGADGRPGFDCVSLGDFLLNVGTQDMELVGTWAPGISSTPYPAGTGVRIPKDARFVAQMHYNTIDEVKSDSSAIKLAMVDDVERVARTILLDDFDLVAPPGLTEATYSWSMDMRSSLFGAAYVRVPRAGYDLLGVFPHMHERGVRQKLRFTDNEGRDDACLYDVDRWDFGWQEFFYYTEDSVAKIERDDSLTLECTYNTVGLDKRLEWGEGTQDEMCLTVLYVAESID